MSRFALIYYGLSCLHFSLHHCQGRLSLPPGGKTLTFFPGTLNARIEWSLNGTIVFGDTRYWTFISRNGSINVIARIVDDNEPEYFARNLLTVEIEKPATLILNNVNDSYNGVYRFEMWPRTGFNLKSDVTVYVAIRPQKINVIFSQGKAKIGEPINITCESEGVPEPRFTITHNNTEVIAGKTYNIPQVKWSDGGLYECIAKSKFGIGSKCHCLTVLGGASSSTKVDRDVADNIVVWHIVVSLILGIVIGCLLSYIVSCSRRKFTSKKPRQPNPEPSKPEVDKTYQELDLTKMNKEENYQSLTVNQPAKNDNRNEDGSNYTELSQTREAEKTYQSLT